MSPESKERTLMEKLIKDHVDDLEITERRTWPADQPKTYGNSVPEENIRIEINDIFAGDAQRELWKLVKQHPEYTPSIVNRLITKGIFYHHQQLTSTRNPGSDQWINNQLSSQIVTDTIFGIGPDALPFLEIHQDKYSKDIAKKLHQKIAVQNFKDTLKNIRTRFNP
jgi:hypothetical protein